MLGMSSIGQMIANSTSNLNLTNLPGKPGTGSLLDGSKGPDISKMVTSDKLKTGYESILRDIPRETVLTPKPLFPEPRNETSLADTMREAQKNAELHQEREVQTRKQAETVSRRSEMIERSQQLADRWNAVVS